MAGPDPTRTPTPSTRRRGPLVGTTVVAALGLLGGGWLAGARWCTPTSAAASPARQAQVLQRGSTVMPFDQARRPTSSSCWATAAPRS